MGKPSRHSAENITAGPHRLWRFDHVLLSGLYRLLLSIDKTVLVIWLSMPLPIPACKGNVVNRDTPVAVEESEVLQHREKVLLRSSCLPDCPYGAPKSLVDFGMPRCDTKEVTFLPNSHHMFTFLVRGTPSKPC